MTVAEDFAAGICGPDERIVGRYGTVSIDPKHLSEQPVTHWIVWAYGNWITNSLLN